MTQELSARAQQVLAAVIASYIAKPEPVGSGTVARMADLNLSPATIRNVMADLEGMGLLTQPHVSAGRVPTAEGMRFYVDTLLEVRELDQEVKDRIRRELTRDPARDVGETLKAAGRALSDLSQNVALVAAPNPETEVVLHIEFILLHPGLILVVLVSKGAAVQNRIIEAEVEITQEDLDKYSRYLNELVADLNLTQVKERIAREMAREKVRFDKILSRALALGKKALDKEVDGEVFIEGQTHLFGAPEFSDIGRLRQIFQAFEEKSTMLRLLEKAIMAQGVQIFIGAESDLAELDGLTTVAAAYGGENSPLGALGVVGPHRMDYSKVIPIVDYTARLVGRILEERD